MSNIRMDLSNRTLGVMLMIGWLTFLFLEPLKIALDDLTSDQPWFDAEIEIVGSDVEYTRTINRWMRGEWTAVVEVPRRTANSWRGVCDRSGRWTYRPTTTGTIPMEFDRFTGGCLQPDRPHRVCADYVMTDAHGRTRDFGPFCSDLFDPRSQ